MIKTENFAQVEIASEAALWEWLAEHHGQDDSVWLVTFKRHVAGKYVSREAVLDALVAFGWIDGIRRKVDDARTMQLVGPRRQQTWAKSYKDRAARLEAAGRMQPAGQAAIARAKAAGLWDAMAEVDALIVPDDLAQALSAGGADWFAASAPSYRRNVLRWIAQAKTTPTRSKRVAEVATRAARSEKVPQF